MENNVENSIITEQSWQARAEKAEAQVANLMHEMEYLKSQMRLLSAKRYGASVKIINKTVTNCLCLTLLMRLKLLLKLLLQNLNL